MKYLRSLADKLYGFLRAFMLWILSAGPIPNHIAIIMDGNRRFADRMHVERRIGHAHGYDALIRILKDCFDLRVKVVSVYAFSIDNFKRSPEEVSALMDLMKSKLDALVDREDLVKDYGVKVRVLGELSLLPDSVRLAAERAMRLTSQNESVILNICVPYTSTNEIVKAIQRIRDAIVTRCGDVSMSVMNGYNGSAYPIFPSNATLKANHEIIDDSHTSQRSFDHLSSANGKFRNEFTNVKMDSNGLKYAASNGNLECDFSYTTTIGKFENDCSHADTIYKLENGFSQANINGKLENSFSHSARNGKLKDGFSHSARNGKLKDGFSHSACNGKSGNHLNDAASNGKMENGFFHSTSSTKFDSGFSHILQNGELDIGSNNAHNNGKFEMNSRYTISNLHMENGFIENGNSACEHTILTKLVKDSITEETIDEHMYTSPYSTPDILIRTSGETRLSNFMLWQTSFSYLAFSKILWPEFSLHHLFFIILEYQRELSALGRKHDALTKAS